MERQKQIIAIHDISCIGKCSLTVALPVLSASGFSCGVIPTSILSSHTGGFVGYTFRDLTEDILPILHHWSSLNLEVDAIYTGYLGSKEQTALMEVVFDRLSTPDTLLFVDPVMGDHGRLYTGFEADFPAQMAKLCHRAHILTPNITEACFLLGKPYLEPPHDIDYVNHLIRGLAAAFSAQVVLSGVQLDEAQMGAAALDPADGEIHYAFRPYVKGRYHGTGDLFASALLSALLSGLSLQRGMEIAVHFVTEAMAKTPQGHDLKFGVRFEAALPGLMRDLGLI